MTASRARVESIRMKDKVPDSNVKSAKVVSILLPPQASATSALLGNTRRIPENCALSAPIVPVANIMHCLGRMVL